MQRGSIQARVEACLQGHVWAVIPLLVLQGNTTRDVEDHQQANAPSVLRVLLEHT